MAVHMGSAEFDSLVDVALEGVPSDLLDMIDNCVLVVEDEPPPELGELLGLYEGIPAVERGFSYGGVEPDRITIFRGPTLRMCADAAEVADEVRVTVVHEIAHHFGIDDERLHALGWG